MAKNLFSATCELKLYLFIFLGRVKAMPGQGRSVKYFPSIILKMIFEQFRLIKKIKI